MVTIVIVVVLILIGYRLGRHVFSMQKSVASTKFWISRAVLIRSTGGHNAVPTSRSQVLTRGICNNRESTTVCFESESGIHGVGISMSERLGLPDAEISLMLLAKAVLYKLIKLLVFGQLAMQNGTKLEGKR